LKKENRRTVISYESIYRFIDSQIRRTKDYSWRHYLPASAGMTKGTAAYTPMDQN